MQKNLTMKNQVGKKKRRKLKVLLKKNSHHLLVLVDEGLVCLEASEGILKIHIDVRSDSFNEDENENIFYHPATSST